MREKASAFVHSLLTSVGTNIKPLVAKHQNHLTDQAAVFLAGRFVNILYIELRETDESIRRKQNKIKKASKGKPLTEKSSYTAYFKDISNNDTGIKGTISSVYLTLLL